MMNTMISLISLYLVLISMALPCIEALHKSSEGEIARQCKIIDQKLRTGNTGLRTQLMIDHVKSACQLNKSPCNVLAQELSRGDLEDLSARIGENVCDFRGMIKDKNQLAQHNNESFYGGEYIIDSMINSPLCYCAPRLPIIHELCRGANNEHITNDQVFICNSSENYSEAIADQIKGNLIYSMVASPNSTDNQIICISQTEAARDIVCGEIMVPILILVAFAIILTLTLAYLYVKYRTEGKWTPESVSGNELERNNYLDGSMTNYSYSKGRHPRTWRLSQQYWLYKIHLDLAPAKKYTS